MKKYIKFEQDGFVNGELVFKKGEIYSFESVESANRWINRGHTEVTEKEFKAPAKKEVVPPTPPITPPKNDKKKVEVKVEDEDGL